MPKLNFKFKIIPLLFLFSLVGFFLKPVYSDSPSIPNLQVLDRSKPDRCQDELDSLHAVSGNGQYIVFVRTCFKEDWWNARVDKSSSVITDNLIEKTIEEPSMVYIKDAYQRIIP